jgi:integrase
VARLIGRLTALKVAHAREPGMLADGDGLYLQVSNATSKSWIFRYRYNGKQREMGLGPLKSVSLAAAREKARDYRAQLADGINPLAARQVARARIASDDAKAMTFDQCAEACIEAHSGAWKSAVHRMQWETTLATYVSPVFGSLPVQAVDVGLVMKALMPIWATKPDTAARVRGRIELVLNWAKARGYRSGENPALWKGHLDNLLPPRVKAVKHHAALPFDQTAKFMKALRAQEGVAPLALEFAILTAARTAEIIGALWNEIDLKAKIWTVPASRMKSNREHRVPLSAQALAVLGKLDQGDPADHVFAGRSGGPLSNMALLMLVRRMKHGKLTAHGFRSTFRDWAAERTNFQAEVAEAALGHVVGDKVELAYRRGDFFEKRRRLMEAWGEFATKQQDSSVVLSLRGPTT